MIYVFTHLPDDRLGNLAEALDHREQRYRVIELCREVPARFPFESASGLVVMGGPMNVYENDLYPFLDFEDHVLRLAVELDFPVLGICLGAQLLARAIGGRVRRNRVKEIGWRTVRTSLEGEQDPLLRHLAPEACVFQWHGDTFDLPMGAVHLAWSDVCYNQAFRYGRSYGLQFHLEVDEAMVEEWLAEPGNQAEQWADPEGIRRDTPALGRRQRELADRVFGTWIESLRQSA